jgi:WD40 repeat protein
LVSSFFLIFDFLTTEVISFYLRLNPDHDALSLPFTTNAGSNHNEKSTMVQQQQQQRSGSLKKLLSNLSMSRKKSTQKNKAISEKNPSSSITHARPLPEIPSSVWSVHVFPYLDRKSQSRLAAASKDVYQATIELTLSWPLGRYKTKAPVISLALSPDSTTLVVVYCRSTIHLWNSRRGHYRTLLGHAGGVIGVQYSPDGKLLASASRKDGTVRLWSVTENYRCIRILKVHQHHLRHLKFSPRGDKLVTWGYDGIVRVSNILSSTTGGSVSTLWKTLMELKGCHETVAFSMDGTTLAYGFNHRLVRLWDLESNINVMLPHSHDVRSGDYAAFITAVAYSPDGIHLVVGCHVATIKFWNVSDYSYTRKIHLGSGWSSVTLITFSPDSKQMACSSHGSQIRMFNVANGTLVCLLVGHTARVEALDFDFVRALQQPSSNQTGNENPYPNGRMMLVSGGCDRTIRFWNFPNVPLNE